MLFEKINEHEYIITLGRALNGPAELQEIISTAIALYVPEAPAEFSTEAYTIDSQTMIFVHFPRKSLWYFDSLLSALDAIESLPDRTVNLYRGRTGEWYIDLPAAAPLNEFGEYIYVDPAEMPVLSIPSTLLQ